MKAGTITLAMVLITTTLFAQQLRIAQVDTSKLLVRGTIDAYVSLSPAGTSAGDARSAAILSPESWTAWERIAAPASGRMEERPLEIVDVVPGAAVDTGIDFLLLVDNSGSMYELAPDGRTRMEHAQAALAEFLESIDESNDRVALAAFNTFIYPLARLGASTGELTRSLSRIDEPETESSYTELYQAMSRQLEEFAGSTGRKAVVVLSDGEDYPFSFHSGMTHPVWGDERLVPDEVIRRFREEEVTLYGVSFADAPDRDLARIARSTGGTVFEAYDDAQLARVYTSIRNSIRGEIRVRVRVPAAGTIARNVAVEYAGELDNADYFAPLLMGEPGDPAALLLAIVAIVAVAGIVALHLVHFESAAKHAEIQPIGGGKTVLIQNDVTVIGSAPEAEVSLVGSRGVDQRHATVVHDPDKGNYTLVTERPVRVNNSLVRKRELKPGDVIAIEDVTLVFDAPRQGGQA